MSCELRAENCELRVESWEQPHGSTIAEQRWKDEKPEEQQLKQKGAAMGNKTRKQLPSPSGARFVRSRALSLARAHIETTKQPPKRSHEATDSNTGTCPIILYTPFAVCCRYICIFMCQTSQRRAGDDAQHRDLYILGTCACVIVCIYFMLIL